MKPRDYKAEYANYHGKPQQIANRAKRNAARATVVAQGRARKGDGKEVDHKVPLSKGGSNMGRNLRVISMVANRRKGNK